MKYWLFKSEPESYSIDDLKKDKHTRWSGVRNYQARNYMTQQMAVGDLGVFYHSNANPPGAVGIVKITTKASADATAFDSRSDYFDAKSTVEKPIWECVEVGFVSKYKRLVNLAELKTVKALAKMELLKKGSRLSIQPLTQREFETLKELGHSSAVPPPPGASS